MGLRMCIAPIGMARRAVITGLALWALLLGLAAQAQPVARAAPMPVALNTPTTLDLTPFVTGSGITGVSIVTEAQHGTVEVNGMRVTYKPIQDFFGSDSFAYKAFGIGGASLPATVGVVVTGRPDPSGNSTVLGLIDAQVQSAKRFARAQIANYQRRMESLHYFGAGVAEGEQRRDTNVWIGGSANVGNRESTGASAALSYSTDTLSVGADKRWSNRLALGMGLGFNRDRTELGADGTKAEASATSLAGYGSFHPSSNTYVDALLGIGKLDFDTDRWVSPAREFATGRRKSDQLFGSVAAGYDHRIESLLISPYGRIDFSVDRHKPFSESGAGLAALSYGEHKQTSGSLAAGVRAESQHETDFGAAQPRLRAEYRREFGNERSVSVAYADPLSGQVYSVMPTGTSRNALLLGMGVDFLFGRGLRVGIDYAGERSSGSHNVQSLRFLVSQDLDFKGAQSWGFSALPFKNPIRVEGGVTYDDNVTRGREANEILSDRSYSLSVGLDKEYRLGTNFRATVTPLLTGEEFSKYPGLSRVSGGMQAEVQYRRTADFDATTYAILARGLYDRFESNLRTGERYYVGFNARKSLTDRIDLFGEVGRNVRYGESAVFELKDYAAKFNLDYSLGREGSLYFSGEYRRGDIVSSGRASLVNVALADVFAAEDAFDAGFFAYRFEGKTALGTIGYNYPLGPRDSLDFSWRHVQSKPDKSPSFDAGESIRYKVNQYSVVYLIRF